LSKTDRDELIEGRIFAANTKSLMESMTPAIRSIIQK